MTEESIAKRFERLSDEDYGKFERIPETERLNRDKTLCGYLKVQSLLLNPNGSVIGGADHDVIFLPSPEELKPLTDDDIVYLLRCGIGWDSNGYLRDFC